MSFKLLGWMSDGELWAIGLKLKFCAFSVYSVYFSIMIIPKMFCTVININLPEK